jgi:hypothetical protein
MKVLCASAVPLQQQNVSPYQRFRQHRNARSFLVSFTVVVCFAFGDLPTQIMTILATSNAIELPWYYMWFVILRDIGVSAVNPFIYGTLDKKLFYSFIKRMRKVIPI